MEARAALRAPSLTCRTSKEAAAPIAIEALGKRTSCFDRALDTELSLEAYRRAANGAQWVHEKILELPGAPEAQSFFQEGSLDNRLIL